MLSPASGRRGRSLPGRLQMGGRRYPLGEGLGAPRCGMARLENLARIGKRAAGCLKRWFPCLSINPTVVSGLNGFFSIWPIGVSCEWVHRLHRRSSPEQQHPPAPPPFQTVFQKSESDPYLRQKGTCSSLLPHTVVGTGVASCLPSMGEFQWQRYFKNIFKKIMKNGLLSHTTET